MLLGGMLAQWLSPLSPIIPYIISAMLFVTFLQIRPRDLSIRRSHALLMGVQAIGTVAAYLIGLSVSQTVAAGLLLCFITPAATAGPVVVGLLRGDSGYTTTYVLLSHAAIILVAPIVLPAVGRNLYDVSFAEQSYAIFAQIFPLIVPAIALAWAVRYVAPRSAERIGRQSWLSFTLWLVSLLLLMAHTVHFIRERDSIRMADIALMAGVGFVACVTQFAVGEWLGKRIGAERHAVRHACAQKNTTLAIWLASLFLTSLSALACAAYIIWQNLAIAYVLAKHKPSA